MSTAQNPNCSKTDKCMHISIIVLLLVAIASSIWSGLQVTKMETLKVGTKSNPNSVAGALANVFREKNHF